MLFLMLSTEDLPGKIGKEQIQWAQKTLADNAKVRWTMVFLHRPLWDEPGVADNGFPEVEKRSRAGSTPSSAGTSTASRSSFARG